MKIEELFEAITPVGTTTSPVPNGIKPAVTATVGGNVADLSNPAVQAATLAKQKQEREQQKKTIQTQITTVQQQLRDLQRQQQDLAKPA